MSEVLEMAIASTDESDSQESTRRGFVSFHGTTSLSFTDLVVQLLEESDEVTTKKLRRRRRYRLHRRDRGQRRVNRPGTVSSVWEDEAIENIGYNFPRHNQVVVSIAS